MYGTFYKTHTELERRNVIDKKLFKSPCTWLTHYF